jgi:hypothetical protein
MVRPSGYDAFVLWCLDGCPGREYRFCGSLGFGGKFHCERDIWRVSCYPEDSTLERRAAGTISTWTAPRPNGRVRNSMVTSVDGDWVEMSNCVPLYHTEARR